MKAIVGGGCYHTILKPIFKIKYWFDFMPNIGAMAIAPYGIQKYDNMSYFSQKLCFNVKIALSERWSEL